jgi:hypothetical protein
MAMLSRERPRPGPGDPSTFAGWIFRVELLQQSWNRVDHDEIHPALPCAGPSRRSGSIPGEPHPPLEQISVSRFRFPKGL